MKCKDLAIDLMHLSTNELSEIKDLARLKAHIKECPDCRKKLKKLREVDTFSFLASPRSEKYKRKMAELSERIKAESRPVLTPARLRHSGGDAKWEIDSAAEKIHNFVKAYTGSRRDKKVAIPVIRKKTGLVDYPFYEAMGSLVTNEKFILTKDKDNRPDCVLLVPILR
jgi:anti-sigma factor RsiW